MLDGSAHFFTESARVGSRCCFPRLPQEQELVPERELEEVALKLGVLQQQLSLQGETVQR